MSCFTVALPCFILSDLTCASA